MDARDCCIDEINYGIIGKVTFALRLILGSSLLIAQTTVTPCLRLKRSG